MPEAATASGEIPFAAAPLRWWRQGPPSSRPLLLLAHGAGAPSSSPFMAAVSAGLVQRGVTVVRFDFPYMTRAAQEGRRRPPDRAAVLVGACGAILEHARTSLRGSGASGAGIFVGGKSLGGRMWSMLLAEQPLPHVRAAVYLGYPLHPPGKPTKLRAAHLPDVPVPQLFVSGSRDPLARLESLREVLQRLPGARLFVVQGGDHSLATQRREPLRGSEVWLDEVARFIHAARA